MTQRPHLAREWFLANPKRDVALGSALLVAFILAASAIPASPLAVDKAWSEWMRDVQTSRLTDLALVFNYLGRGVGRALVLVAIGVPLLVRRRRAALAAYALTEALAPFASSVTKAVVERPRPPDPLVHAGGFSFPSGHATFAGATCVALVLLYSRRGRVRRLSWVAAGAGIAAMAWSRTYLQVHWLSDAVAGSLLGIAIACLVFAEVQELVDRKITRREDARGREVAAGSRVPAPP